jgi:putative acetyltransferase
VRPERPEDFAAIRVVHERALAPMAVLPEHQRRGVGSALVTEGLRRAAESEFPLVVVLGTPRPSGPDY